MLKKSIPMDGARRVLFNTLLSRQALELLAEDGKPGRERLLALHHDLELPVRKARYPARMLGRERDRHMLAGDLQPVQYFKDRPDFFHRYDVVHGLCPLPVRRPAPMPSRLADGPAVC